MAAPSHCPFDGGEAKVFESHHFATREIDGLSRPGTRATRYRIVCLKCKASGPSKGTPEDATDCWNHRVLFPIHRSDAPPSLLNLRPESVE